MLPSPRRAFLGLSGALTIALVGNLGGLTSWLLGLDGGQLAGRLQIDALYPVRGYKRCLDQQYGFTFLYPSSWLADQRLYMRNVERAERMRSLDPPAPSRAADPMAPRSPPAAQQQQAPGGRPRPRQAQYEPVVGLGPPGGTGQENVSVIVAPIERGFSLEMMGEPAEAAATLLAATIAPPGGDREAQVLSATARRDDAGLLYYETEFVVRAPTFVRHNLFVYAARGDLLYTLNFTCPEARWPEVEAAARKTGASFRMLDSSAVAPPPPTRPAVPGGP